MSLCVLINFLWHDMLLVNWPTDTLTWATVIAADILSGSSLTERLFQESQEVSVQVI